LQQQSNFIKQKFVSNMAEYRLHQDPIEPSTSKQLLQWIGKYWFQMTLAFFVWQLYLNREVSTDTRLEGQPVAFASEAQAQKVNAAFVEELSITPLVFDKSPAKAPAKKWNSTDFKNLSFVLSPGFAAQKGVDAAIVKEKTDNCRKYVERFAATAISEMKQFGIPASITLAQGLIETDAGGSRLATDSNNHFGIKCRSKCRHCTCRNYSDDDVYDMFRVFDTAWESFREHSKLLQIDRYKNLKKLGASDYEGWARGLKKAGYATDKNYDKKLIQIIEALDLHQFDE
jgi:flagellum-specific peptidoglycan hydrolase FlgJ